MKKIYSAIASLLLVLFFLLPGHSFAQTPTNLISNPSVESGSTAPVDWFNNKWGTNSAIFTYNTRSGYQGTKSLTVQITSYTSGDAKWYFKPVAVTPNTQYKISNYYKATVSSEFIIRVTDTSGNFTYYDVAYPAASSRWKNQTVTFTTPANARELTVFHIINKVGTLQTDNFTMALVTPTPTPTITPSPTPITPTPTPIPGNAVPNSSVESVSTSNSNLPASWSNNKWGTNNATFTYLTTGHSGSRSVKAEITSYTSGDAKWFYTPQAVVPGKTLQFSDYYKSNTTTQIVVQVNKTDGTTMYFNLRNASPAAEWTRYSDSFTVPVGASTLTVLHLINSVGFLITDDYSLVDYVPQGFNRPIVTLTFDDGWEENNTTALPVLSNYGFKSTQFYATTFIENNPAGPAGIREFYDAGHEIGSHSVTHPDMTTLTPAELTYELSHSKEYLESIVGPGKIKNFATPFGAYNSQVLSGIQQYYQSHRTVDQGYNSKDNFDIYRLKVQNMLNNTSLSQYNSWLNQAKTDKTWLILVYHRVGANPEQYETAPADFSQQMQALKNSGLTVLTMEQALAEILPQIDQ